MTKEYIKEVPNWEKDYLSLEPQISKRQRELLEGAKIGSHEGMLYGQMYADWKKRRWDE
jgi:hypothetical protein